MERQALAEAVRQEQPDIVGTTALTSFLYKAVEVAEVAKDVDRRIITVLGGPHVTYLPEETLRENAAIDIVACGEGESAMTDLVRCVERGGQLSQVKGIGFRSNGSVILTEPQPLVDMNELPLPAYHLLPMQKYHFALMGRFATVIASRGCPHRCTFCSQWKFWRGTWRAKSPKRIADEMEYYSREFGSGFLWLTGPAQAQTFKVGSFNKISTVASQNVAHGLGEAPKALILWTNGKTDENFGTSFLFAFGMTDQSRGSYSVALASRYARPICGRTCGGSGGGKTPARSTPR
jgi:hypothetical protein